jgi:hypothetical protein
VSTFAQDLTVCISVPEESLRWEELTTYHRKQENGVKLRFMIATMLLPYASRLALEDTRLANYVSSSVIRGAGHDCNKHLFKNNTCCCESDGALRSVGCGELACETHGTTVVPLRGTAKICSVLTRDVQREVGSECAIVRWIAAAAICLGGCHLRHTSNVSETSVIVISTTAIQYQGEQQTKHSSDKR